MHFQRTASHRDVFETGMDKQTMEASGDGTWSIANLEKQATEKQATTL
jgi:hypothetical protein